MNVRDEQHLVAWALQDGSGREKRLAAYARALADTLTEVDTVAGLALVELMHEPDSLPIRRTRGFLEDLQRIAAKIVPSPPPGRKGRAATGEGRHG